MLEQQKTETSNNVTDTEISPHELVEAIAAIERRKAEEAKRKNMTATVNETIKELGVDATPEEVFAEVQAQRRKAAGADAAKSEPNKATSDKVVEAAKTTAVFAAGLITETIGAAIERRKREKQMERRAKRGIPWIGVALLTWFLFTNPGVFTNTASWFHHVSSDPVNTTLDAVPNNQPVTCLPENLVKLINGAPEQSVQVIEGDDVMSNDWTLIKHDGQLYLRGYTTYLPTNQALTGQSLEIYNYEEDANHATPGDAGPTEITIPLEGTHIVSHVDDGEQSTITLNNVHVDGHESDDWDSN